MHNIYRRTRSDDVASDISRTYWLWDLLSHALIIRFRTGPPARENSSTFRTIARTLTEKLQSGEMTDIVERHKTETNVVDMQACWFYDCSTLRLISNRQTSEKKHRLMPPPYVRGGIIIIIL